MRATFVSALIAAVVLCNIQMFSLQEDPEAQARKDAAREAEARIKMMEQRAIEAEAERRKSIERERERSEANLAEAEARAREVKARENETKFAALEQSAKELRDLSARTYTQIRSSGAQSVSVTVYSDVERMEKLLKEMRKHLK